MTAQSTRSTTTRKQARGRRTSLGRATRHWLRIDRNAALRLSPSELRDALGMERSYVVDQLEDPDESLLSEGDEVAFEDMDGEGAPSDAAEDDPPLPGGLGALTESGQLAPPTFDSVFLEHGDAYVIRVLRDSGTASCWFEPPSWFGRIGPRGRERVERIATLIRALSRLLLEQFQPFLSDPRPEVYGACEWSYFDASRQSIDHSASVRKGLATRMNEYLSEDDRIDASGLGQLLEHVWLIWPWGGTVDQATPPLAFSFKAVFDHGFRVQAAAAMVGGGFGSWTIGPKDLTRDPVGAIPIRRPLRSLDQRDRLRSVASALRLGPEELLSAALDIDRTANHNGDREDPAS